MTTHLNPANTRTGDMIGPSGEPPLESIALHPSVVRADALGDTAWYSGVLLIGLVLLWFYESGDDQLRFALVLVAVFAVFTGLIFLWRLWANDLPASITAGSRWVGSGSGRKAHTVRLYELTKIDTAPSIGYDGGENSGQTNLQLHQGPDLILAFDTAMLETNPELWALVYNGIRYSVAQGAEISRAARERLLIDPPPLDQPDPWSGSI